MRDTFEWAAGSVAGRDHRHSMKNSHDAWQAEVTDRGLVAVVCDGCGSCEHSEVGAWIAAEMIVKQTMAAIQQDPKCFSPEHVAYGLERIQRSVLAHIAALSDAMRFSFSQVVSDYFLFTVLGVAVTPENTTVFGLGDGVYWLNGHRNDLEAENNSPDYLGYLLTQPQGSPGLKPYHFLKTSEVRTILLGTDGAVQLAAAADKNIPGKNEKIGPVSQFWEKDLYFRNPFALGHRLNLTNRDSMAVDYESKTVREEHGPLSDDTTLAVVRRRK